MSLSVDIRKNFGSFVLDTHFESEEGILGFLGASGSGKSMTLKCIAGIVTPDEGRIVLNGVTLFDSKQHINLSPQKRRVGYLFQNYALFPTMTLEKNIEAGAHRIRDRHVRAQLVSELIAQMALTGLETQKPSRLSGGQQQRCALARILASQPDILLLDEPFSALDSYLREQLITDMKVFLKHYGKDVILVSHSRSEIYQLCDQAAIVSGGRIQTPAKTKALFAKPVTVDGAVLTGCKNIADAKKTGEHEIFVPSWNVHFTTKEPVPDQLRAVGIRAHYFHPTTDANAHPVELVEEIEEPFEWTLKFRYPPSEELIWWRLPKEKRPNPFPKKLGVSPANIMLLIETASDSPRCRRQGS